MVSNFLGLNYYTNHIVTPRLILRHLTEQDISAWIQARQANYDHLQKWEPVWDMDAATYIGVTRFINDLRNAFAQGNYYSFAIFERETGILIGNIEVSNVLSWPKQCATIGYWMSADKQGRGYMSEAVRHTCIWASQTLNLVKIEAGTMTTNERSQRVLINAGFKKEGVSQAYGEIDGVFVDHVLWGAKTKDIAATLSNR